MMDPAQAPGSDRLSALPDDLLRRIMSFLNARHSVQTCVLSRRWRDLWRSLPRINAEFTEFWDPYGVSTDEVEEARFKQFVNTLLLLRDPVPLVDRFWLRYQVSDGNDLKKASAEADLWISHALQLQAPVVEVVTLLYPSEFDHTVFTSQYLRRLGLSNVYINKGFFKQLNTGCPNLEDLLLYDAIILDDEISSETLKILNINESRFSVEYRASISIPSLTSLILYQPQVRVPLLNNMKSLVSASVFLTDVTDILIKETDISELLMSLSGVRNLDLDYPEEKVTIANNMQWCPEFSKLVNLSLGWCCLDSNLYALTIFLQKSPKLEKLTLKPFQVIIAELEERSFKCEHLKIVEVICSKRSGLLKRVEEFFANIGMTSLQINIKSSDKNQYHPADLFRFEYDLSQKERI